MGRGRDVSESVRTVALPGDGDGPLLATVAGVVAGRGSDSHADTPRLGSGVAPAKAACRHAASQ